MLDNCGNEPCPYAKLPSTVPSCAMRTSRAGPESVGVLSQIHIAPSGPSVSAYGRFPRFRSFENSTLTGAQAASASLVPFARENDACGTFDWKPEHPGIAA